MKKFLSLLLINSLLYSSTAFSAGKLQNADFKSEAELIAAGATKAQLLNDDKIYVTANGVNDKLSTAIANGVIGGAGSESGTNLLNSAVASFESNSGWTNTGGTFTYQTYTNGINGDTKYGRFVASAAAQYVETALLTIPTNFTGGCQFDFKKLNVSTAALFKLEVLDSSNNVLATDNNSVSSWSKLPTLSFQCPAPASTVKIRVTSLAAGTIELDKAYVGSNQNLVASLGSNDTNMTNVGTISIASTGTSPTKGVIVTDRIMAQRKGSRVLADYQYEQSSGGSNGSGDFLFTLPVINGVQTQFDSNLVFFHTGTAISPIAPKAVVGFGKAADGSNPNPGVQLIAYDATRFRVITATNSAANFMSVSAYGLSGAIGFGFRLDAPISGWSEIRQQDIAVSPEQASWFIDVNIGGGNPIIPSPTSTYTEFTDAGLDLFINSGSASAEIACSGTNPSTGLTCSAGSESVGIAFTPKMTGRHRICAYYSSNYGSGSAAVQLIETPNNAQTILQEGNTRLAITQTSGSGGDYAPQSNCAFFNFSSISKRTVRLMGEVNSGAMGISADRSGTIGQRDIHFTVENMEIGQIRPILTGGTNITPGLASSGNIDLFSVSFGTTNLTTPCTTTPCFIDQIGNAVTSVTRASSGNYSLNVAKTYSKIKCVSHLSNSGDTLQSATTGSLQCSNCSTVPFSALSYTGGARDVVGNILCQGLN